MPSKPDRRRATTEVRLELRRQMLLMREQGKTHVEIAQITGYTRTYVSAMLSKLHAAADASGHVARRAQAGEPASAVRKGRAARADADLRQVPRSTLDALCAVDARCDPQGFGASLVFGCRSAVSGSTSLAGDTRRKRRPAGRMSATMRRCRTGSRSSIRRSGRAPSENARCPLGR